jgi:hypothetical protein
MDSSTFAKWYLPDLLLSHVIGLCHLREQFFKNSLDDQLFVLVARAGDLNNFDTH